MMLEPKRRLERDDVGILARWIHEAVVRLEAVARLESGSPESSPWVKLPATSKDKYRRLACELLTSPPPALRKAVRRLED